MFRKESIVQRAHRQIGFMNDFINQLQEAKNDAKILHEDAQEVINEAKDVQTSCNEVTKFVNKILG